MDRVLVTGGRGLVGSAIRSLEKEYPQFEFIYTGSRDHDLTKEREVKRLFDQYKPEMLLGAEVSHNLLIYPFSQSLIN